MTRPALVVVVLTALIVPSFLLRAYAARHSEQYEWEMQDPVDDPPDADDLAEFTFARLRYPQFTGGGGFGGGGFARRGRGRGFGGRGQSWGIDSNRADRLFDKAVRRLTRVNIRSVEDVIDIDDGPLFEYPWIYAVEVGHWELNDDQAKRLRTYFDRGGFLMVDDFHGSYEWAVFMEGLHKIFPDRQVVDIPNNDAIFHIVFDLADRYQVPGTMALYNGVTYEQDGYNAEWKGIMDDQGRVQVAICHNMDLGDAWQYADDPGYPEKYAALAFRIAVNYVAYAMTH